ncbi:MAG: hypothetical protein BK997_05150 [Candidatus Micrarchaeum sp. ARMAN-1]|jgi:hypothetical protein|nr:MAG: hypothetical protein BK997_05150 [Candidatus Micrarchaeum sp. ARMAN-1]OJT94233.1 MAG: hypothetical protein JJ59_04735 [Candidatus Micrarchaeum sp. AZ1]OWP53423.1 MAG: hypothetical protein B2I19_03160 [Thermoplasmatales archaeon ARMAN]
MVYMVIYDSNFGAYMCELCMLHYETEELAKKCEAWDRLHDSCNLAIASRSIEAISRRESLNK